MSGSSSRPSTSKAGARAKSSRHTVLRQSCPAKPCRVSWTVRRPKEKKKKAHHHIPQNPARATLAGSNALHTRVRPTRVVRQRDRRLTSPSLRAWPARVHHPPVMPRHLAGFRSGQLLVTTLVPNSRGSDDWFATFARAHTPRTSTVRPGWARWQTAGLSLPNTVPGSRHDGLRLRCWRCGVAAVEPAQIHCIKNSSIWTNSDALTGCKLDSRVSYNRFKKCDVQSVICTGCGESVGTSIFFLFFLTRFFRFPSPILCSHRDTSPVLGDGVHYIVLIGASFGPL